MEQMTLRGYLISQDIIASDSKRADMPQGCLEHFIIEIPNPTSSIGMIEKLTSFLKENYACQTVVTRPSSVGLIVVGVFKTLGRKNKIYEITVGNFIDPEIEVYFKNLR